MPVGNCFWIFPYLFSVALPGKTCAIYHSSFYWYKDIRCISCSSDWEVRSFQNRVFPTRNIEKSANSERRRLVDLNCKMNTEISPVKTSRNWDKERDQIEGRGTALCVSTICCLFSFFMRDLYDALHFRIHMTVLESTHWGSQTGSAIGDHLIKEHDMEPDDWHRTEFEHPKKLLKYTSVSYFWNAFYQRTETTAKQTMWLNPCEVIILDSSLNSKSRLLNDTSSKPNGGFKWAVDLKYSLEESCFH